MVTDRNRERGFTMLELVVVLAIGTVLVVVAIPSFIRTKYHLDLQGAAQTLVSDLRTAQANAIRQGATATLDYPHTQQSFQDFCNANVCTTKDGNGNNASSISFTSAGYVSVPAVMPFTVTMQACHTGETLKVQVQRTGRIQTLTVPPSSC
jgi:prepilin-type N-terminal cleavage/methylation domain-containing protein